MTTGKVREENRVRKIRTPGLTGIICAAAAGLAMASFASSTTVHSVTELTNVLANVKANDEVVIAEGTYNLAGMKMHAVGHLYVTNTITLRGETGNPADVVLQGSGERILYLHANNATIRDITFKGGDCSKYTASASSSVVPFEYLTGGGLCLGLTYRNTTAVSNCVFDTCKAKMGGAAAMYMAAQTGSSLRYAGKFRNCRFVNCTSTSSGACLYNAGEVYNCRFENNDAGLTKNLGVAFHCNLIDGCVFEKNTGVCVTGSGSTHTNFIVTGCSFLTNYVRGTALAAVSGGSGVAVTNNATSLFVTNCYFAGNENLGIDYIGSGGVSYCWSNVVDCVFVGNKGYYGGAAYKSVLTDCRFYGNMTLTNGTGIASAYGGAAYNSTLVRCELAGNSAVGAGGGAYDCDMTDCVISNNVTRTNGGGAYGGTLTGCKIIGNTASSYGGGIHGGTLTNCIIAGNCGYNGGGGTSCNFHGCVISNNVATYAGGGVYTSTLAFCTNTANRCETSNPSEVYNSWQRVTDCLFHDVSARDQNGCIFRKAVFERCVINASTGTLFVGESAITNCLIAGGRDFYMFSNASAGNMFMVNCTIVSNNYAGLKNGGNNPNAEVVNCLFYGNSFSGTYSGNPFPNVDVDGNAKVAIKEFRNCIFRVRNGNAADAPGSGNYDYYSNPSFDPKFMGAADPAHPYALRLSSPAVSGNGVVTGETTGWAADATDIRGEGFPRIRDGLIDIGCYQCWLKPRGVQFFFR